MSYEEREARQRRQHEQEAIALAMQARWEEAVATNKKIIESFPRDVDAYNRLGRAYMELGEYSLAREAYSQATKLDPANTIAARNLHRLSQLGETAVGARSDAPHAEPHHFIEEMGKAGVTNLGHLAPRVVVVKMVAGNQVYLKTDGTKLVVENGRGEYLGQIEPRHAQRLIKLMEGGNKYTTAVVSSAEDRLTVIIREVYQHPSQAGQLSFPSRGVEKLQPYISGSVFQPGLEEERARLAEANGLDDELNNQE